MINEILISWTFLYLKWINIFEKLKLVVFQTLSSCQHTILSNLRIVQLTALRLWQILNWNMFSNTRNIIFWAIKLLLDIGLIILAVFLCLEILIQFLSNDSSFKQSQVPITTTPTITICLSPFNIGILCISY